MTAEEYSKKATDMEIANLWQTLVDGGILSPDEEDDKFALSLARNAYGWIKVLEDNHIIHSRDEEWEYNGWDAQKLSEAISGLFYYDAVRLCHSGDDKLCIHEWCEDDSFVMALCRCYDGFDMMLETISFSIDAGDHFELVGREMKHKVDIKSLSDLGKEISGFSSYDQHSLDAFIRMAGYSRYLTCEGLVMPVDESSPSIPGSVVLASDSDGMSILGASYGFD